MDCVPQTPKIYRPSAHSGWTLEGPADISPTLWRRRIKADILLAQKERKKGREESWVWGKGKKEETRKGKAILFLYFIFQRSQLSREPC